MTNKSEKEGAQELYEHRHDEGEWSEEPAKIESRRIGSEVVSFRLPSNELTALESAARAAGESLSGFIREAITEHVRRRTAVHWLAISSPYLAVRWGYGIEGSVEIRDFESTEQWQVVDCLPHKASSQQLPA